MSNTNLAKTVETLQKQLETVSGYVSTGQQNMVKGVQSADGNLQNYITDNNTNLGKMSLAPGESLNLKDSELPKDGEVTKVDGTLYFNNDGNLKMGMKNVPIFFLLFFQVIKNVKKIMSLRGINRHPLPSPLPQAGEGTKCRFALNNLKKINQLIKPYPKASEA